mmetsp:Transcript_8352/g.52083  ORF Transcript_8352/g.52083 Transcript_8352/m.52083 type:complete len:127 (+) Transcript_8352:152-532(+)
MGIEKKKKKEEGRWSSRMGGLEWNGGALERIKALRRSARRCTHRTAHVVDHPKRRPSRLVQACTLPSPAGFGLERSMPAPHGAPMVREEGWIENQVHACTCAARRRQGAESGQVHARTPGGSIELK